MQLQPPKILIDKLCAAGLGNSGQLLLPKILIDGLCWGTQLYRQLRLQKILMDRLLALRHLKVLNGKLLAAGLGTSLLRHL